MTRRRFTAGIAAAMMVGAFTASQVLRPTKHLADMIGHIELEKAFPAQFGDWKIDDLSGPVQLVSPVLQAVIDRIYNQTLSRTYVNSTGQRIMLSVAYGGDQSDATRAHRPEVCYPAQGFQIMSSGTGSISGAGREILVRQLVAKSGARIEPITYWVITGNDISQTGTQQKISQLRYSLRGVIPDGMLVRVSNIDADPKAAFGLHERFIAELSAALPREYRDRIIGAAAADRRLLGS